MYRIADWLNKHITHPRDKQGDYGVRVTIHACLFPLVTAILLVDPIGGPIILATFTYIFNKYQRNEDLHTEDQAWKDQAGFMWALGLGVLLYLIIRILVSLQSGGKYA